MRTAPSVVPRHETIRAERRWHGAEHAVPRNKTCDAYAKGGPRPV